MSNYPNMSYCMFENTSSAIDQLVEAMTEAIRDGKEGVEEFLSEMNRSELRVFYQMYEQVYSLKNCLEEIEDIGQMDPQIPWSEES